LAVVDELSSHLLTAYQRIIKQGIRDEKHFAVISNGRCLLVSPIIVKCCRAGNVFKGGKILDFRSRVLSKPIEYGRVDKQYFS
jgi:hypothetical protein